MKLWPRSTPEPEPRGRSLLQLQLQASLDRDALAEMLYVIDRRRVPDPIPWARLNTVAKGDYRLKAQQAINLLDLGQTLPKLEHRAACALLNAVTDADPEVLFNWREEQVTETAERFAEAVASFIVADVLKELTVERLI